MWYKGNLCRQISLVKQGKSHIWLRLNQTLGITDRDLYLCAICIPPVDSPFFEENIFDTLHSEIAYFQAQGNMLLTGDLKGEQELNLMSWIHRATTMYLVRPPFLPHQPSPVGTTLSLK